MLMMMFYDRGQEKKTASAVVADDRGSTVPSVLENVRVESEKQELLDVSRQKKRYFLRFQGDASDLTEAECCFGKVNAVVAPLAGEFGFTTGVMTEKEHQVCAAKTDRVISMLAERK